MRREEERGKRAGEWGRKRKRGRAGEGERLRIFSLSFFLPHSSLYFPLFTCPYPLLPFQDDSSGVDTASPDAAYDRLSILPPPPPDLGPLLRVRDSSALPSGSGLGTAGSGQGARERYAERERYRQRYRVTGGEESREAERRQERKRQTQRRRDRKTDRQRDRVNEREEREKI